MVMGRDIISSLPDDILIHIVSLLETQCAIRTGILSKRWHFIWMKSSNIVLNEADFEAALLRGNMLPSHNGIVIDENGIVIDENRLYYVEKIRQKYVSAVNAVLLSHIGPVLNNFGVSFRARFGGEQEYLTRWIRHLTIVKKVKSLSVIFPNSWYLPPYHLSFDLLPCDSITRLVLCGCSIQSFTSCRSFTSIETLVLQDCRVSHDSITSIFTSFPSLKSCTLEDVCMGTSHLFCAPWLKVLNITRPRVVATYLEVNAPNLESLSIGFVEQGKLKVRLRNMESLTNLDLQVLESGHDGFFDKNLAELRRVKNLTFHREDLFTMYKWMSQNHEQVVANQLVSLEHLTVTDFWLERIDQNALVSLLEAAPKLHKLTIDDLLPVDDIEVSVDPSFRGLKNLKQIRVTLVVGRRMFLRLFEFLFKHARSMESLEIEFRDMNEFSNLAFQKELLALPRNGAIEIHFS